MRVMDLANEAGLKIPVIRDIHRRLANEKL
jgi:hypothetical protein